MKERKGSVVKGEGWRNKNMEDVCFILFLATLSHHVWTPVNSYMQRSCYHIFGRVFSRSAFLEDALTLSRSDNDVKQLKM